MAYSTTVYAAALLAVGLVIGIAAGITLIPSQAGTPPDRDALYQVSTIDTLLLGAFDGVYNFSTLETKGDFGIAVFDRLDGEIIGFDGTFYQIRSDGTVHEVRGDATTPFATVTWFEPDTRVWIARADNISDFTTQLEAALPSSNLFYAVRIQGTFPEMKTRAVSRQEKPYPRLVDACKEQSVFMLNNTRGTIAGFYTPEMVEGLNIPGLHIHYLTDDRAAGGHILDFSVENATVELDSTSRFTMWLPEGDQYAGYDLSEDLSGELSVVEKGGPSTTPASG
ncbi:acetolactate decarboxylase [Methanolinea mesophila]|uniref:acetolactate decarboxylase n=1 Tax=Methanolinea mesophila TaxID=547055 RepID=UPI001AE2AD72|nr:acetolactate decarboxylase [Methanolinea mesophila]MBP1928838.1 acetolactate decarboxylase [Methanolinea mesophila]